jgi:hypothetical protein
MKERPILFNGSMVRAILDGSKTQTRRVVKQNGASGNTVYTHPIWEVKPTTGPRFNGHSHDFWRPGAERAYSALPPCPYGQPGDRLWVRETWRGVVEISPPGQPVEHGVARYIPDREHCRRVEYAATQARDDEPWRPSIHMPRWASRILLEIVSVRVERLQDISEKDCWAEGIEAVDGLLDDMKIYEAARRMNRTFEDAAPTYAALWESINGAGSWDANPWVWVVEFRRVTP